MRVLLFRLDGIISLNVLFIRPGLKRCLVPIEAGTTENNVDIPPV